jgi:hypothetical protein
VFPQQQLQLLASEGLAFLIKVDDVVGGFEPARTAPGLRVCMRKDL